MGRGGNKPARQMPPAATPEARESQLISLAYDLAERRLREGTASAQETVHFLRAGSSRDSLEREKIQNENLLLSARRAKMEQETRNEELMLQALQAFRRYSGEEDLDYPGLGGGDGY